MNNKTRSTVRFSDQGMRKLNAIEAELLKRNRRDISRDDIIEHFLTNADVRATIEALSGGRK